MNIDQQLDAAHARRMASWGRYIDRLDRRMAEAEKLIGELCRDGKPVYYVNARNGKAREGSQLELIDFLLRNNYV